MGLQLPTITLPAYPNIKLPKINMNATNMNTPNIELPSFELPKITLASLPGVNLPSPLPSWLTNFELPSFNLANFPGLDLSLYSSFDQISLPSIDLADFPNITLPNGIDVNFKFQLPSINLSEYPNIRFPNTELFLTGLKMNMNIKMNMDMPTLPSIKITTKSMKINAIKFNVGGSLMKLKLFLGFVQCVSFFPITFSSIPFPNTYIELGKILELFSLDFLSFFGGAACELHTNFYRGFEVSFSTIPVIVIISLLSYGVVLMKHSKTSKYTKESATTRLYSLLFMVVYSLYTGVSTKLFRLFKCRLIQNEWYLTADYSIFCSGDEYDTYVLFASIGIGLFTFGIPLFIYILLHCNKKYLHESTCPEKELYKHIKVEKEYGSIYRDYTENNYFFDLLDLGRRLLLTGALILVGSQSNTQIFLGALLCLLWLLVVTVRRPYVAYWDNVLSIVLSLQLVLIMLCGMALEMNRLTPELASDPYEATSFGILMVTFSIIIVITALVSIVISIPFLRDPLVGCYAKIMIDDDDDDDKKKKKSISVKITPA